MSWVRDDTTWLGVVNCGGTKLAHKAPAKEIYKSSYFQAKREFCEEVMDEWIILSAEYGILQPDEVIEPYDKSLETLTSGEIEEWKAEVLDYPYEDYTVVEILLSSDYYEPLKEDFDQMDVPISTPLVRMGIMHQVEFLLNMAEKERRSRVRERTDDPLDW